MATLLQGQGKLAEADKTGWTNWLEFEDPHAWKSDAGHEALADAHWAYGVLPSSFQTGCGMKLSEVARVFLHRKPFAEGALRYAFHAFTDTTHLVTKIGMVA